MLKKMVKAAMLGLTIAMLIIFLSYYNYIPSLKFISDREVVSYNHAVSVASTSVVNIYSIALNENDKKAANLGSGVIMSPKGYILTNKHVIDNAEQIIIATQSGQWYEAILIGHDRLTDLAVLHIQEQNLNAIKYNLKRKTRIGDVVLAIGNPLNLGQSITLGIVSAVGRNTLGSIGRQHLIQTDASINTGNSGGALINTAGEIVGINTFILDNEADPTISGLNFAIPISLAENIMKKIIRDGRVIRGYIGLESDYLIAHGAEQNGILITNVSFDSPAEKAGIQIDDIVLKIDDFVLNSPDQVLEYVANIKPDTSVILTILRDKQEIQLPLVVEEFPDL